MVLSVVSLVEIGLLCMAYTDGGRRWITFLQRLRPYPVWGQPLLYGLYEYEVVQGQGMRNAEMLVWAGDFNYRIDATYEDAIDHIRCNDLEYLLERVRNLSLLLCKLFLLQDNIFLLPCNLFFPLHVQTQLTTQVAALVTQQRMYTHSFHILMLN